jgi:hypothetical protein
MDREELEPRPKVTFVTGHRSSALAGVPPGQCQGLAARVASANRT